MTDSFNPRFWCVWNEGKRSPTVKHDSYHQAKTDAMRLARSNPGDRFVVLAAAAAFEKVDVQKIEYADAPWADDSHIPF